jgi:hypothetical protein
MYSTIKSSDRLNKKNEIKNIRQDTIIPKAEK